MVSVDGVPKREDGRNSGTHAGKGVPSTDTMFSVYRCAQCSGLGGVYFQQFGMVVFEVLRVRSWRIPNNSPVVSNEPVQR